MQQGAGLVATAQGPAPTAEVVRGEVEALGPAGIKLARRWWPLSPTLPAGLPAVGQLVVAEVRDGAVVRLTDIGGPDPDGGPAHRLIARQRAPRLACPPQVAQACSIVSTNRANSKALAREAAAPAPRPGPGHPRPPSSRRWAGPARAPAARAPRRGRPGPGIPQVLEHDAGRGAALDQPQRLGPVARGDDRAVPATFRIGRAA